MLQEILVLISLLFGLGGPATSEPYMAPSAPTQVRRMPNNTPTPAYYLIPEASKQPLQSR